jgi:enoyl-CoA hydratase
LPDELVFARTGNAGRITLNRPQALNALTHAMCREMHAQLAAWADDPAVRLVVVDGAGDKAFCAGGDIRAVYRGRQEGKLAELTAFYHDEYRLNRFIKRYPKPYVALVDGIVMGGGAGISVHGSHRVASERTVFAMPETGIGLFPDVGGSWFLSRLPGQAGCFVGLTSQRLGPADCVLVGLADMVVASGRKPELLAALADAKDVADIDAILQGVALAPDQVPPARLPALSGEIDACFAADEVETILGNLDAAGTEFGREMAALLRQKSPTSLKVTLRALREGARLSFDDCMRMEYRLACRFMQGHDFFEGVRALLIDKDNKPDWRPATLETVTADMVAAYFAPLPEGDLTFD